MPPPEPEPEPVIVERLRGPVERVRDLVSLVDEREDLVFEIGQVGEVRRPSSRLRWRIENHGSTWSDTAARKRAGSGGHRSQGLDIAAHARVDRGTRQERQHRRASDERPERQAPRMRAAGRTDQVVEPAPRGHRRGGIDPPGRVRMDHAAGGSPELEHRVSDLAVLGDAPMRSRSRPAIAPERDAGPRAAMARYQAGLRNLGRSVGLDVGGRAYTPRP